MTHLKKYRYLKVEFYRDVDYTYSIKDIHSTSRYWAYFGGNIVTWISKKQIMVTRSNAEEKYKSMAHIINEISNSSPWSRSSHESHDYVMWHPSCYLYRRNLVFH